MAGSDERDALPALLTHVLAFSCCWSAHVVRSAAKFV
jgi:hypothetical protein